MSTNIRSLLLHGSIDIYATKRFISTLVITNSQHELSHTPYVGVAICPTKASISLNSIVKSIIGIITPTIYNHPSIAMSATTTTDDARSSNDDADDDYVYHSFMSHCHCSLACDCPCVTLDADWSVSSYFMVSL